MNLLLDTQIFLWLESDKRKLSAKAIQACSDPENILWLSVASAWEMQIKVSLSKLVLRRPLAEIIESHQSTNGLQILTVQLGHVLELQNLPFHHKDPFDRLIIAQGVYEDWHIVSVDREFSAYRVSIIW